MQVVIYAYILTTARLTSLQIISSYSLDTIHGQCMLIYVGSSPLTIGTMYQVVTGYHKQETPLPNVSI